VLGWRKVGSGRQYEMQWSGGAPNSWEAASRMRREHPQLIEAFEQLQQQSAEGTADDDAPMPAAVEGPNEALQRQVADLTLLVKQQAQQADEQQREISRLRASPAHSPQLSAQASPHLSPQHQPRSVDASVAAAAAPSSVHGQSRFARKEPRAQDLREYNGAAGAKLDEWRDELELTNMLFELNTRESVRFAVSRLRGAALTWWLDELNSAERVTISDSSALVTALRGRFQHATTAYTARQQLDKLQQGSRGVNEFIADFQRIVAQIGLPSLGEDNALFAFERGLRPNLAEKLREHGVRTLREAVAMAARVGSLQQAGAAQGRAAAANQMDVDDDGSAGRLDRIEAALNAMAARNTDGMGAKTQMHQGYTKQRGGRGGARGGRDGFKPRGPPEVPGVPEHVVRQRLDAQQCIRCGQEGHRSPACPNAITARGN